MARPLRTKSINGIYHVMLRGINKQTIFEDDEDRLRFLDVLKRYKMISKFELYSYCLMDNHVHLLIKETEETVSKAIQRISASYVYWYNNKYERCGHLFQGRFRSENVNTTRYFFSVLRYIHQNPVKAGLAKNPFECKWTSIHEYLGQANIIDTDLALNLIYPERGKAVQIFRNNMLILEDKHCLDDYQRVRMTDLEVKNYLSSIGIQNHSTLQQMGKEERDAVIMELKGLSGVSIRQLSRVTGISKSAIDRICKNKVGQRD